MGVLASESEGKMTATLHHNTLMHRYEKFGGFRAQIFQLVSRLSFNWFYLQMLMGYKFDICNKSGTKYAHLQLQTDYSLACSPHHQLAV